MSTREEEKGGRWVGYVEMDGMTAGMRPSDEENPMRENAQA
jgi:hypothetical protein